MELAGTQWNSEEPRGTPWNPEEPRGTQWNSEEPRGTPWNPEEPRGAQRNPVELRGTQRNPEEPRGTLACLYSASWLATALRLRCQRRRGSNAFRAHLASCFMTCRCAGLPPSAQSEHALGCCGAVDAGRHARARRCRELSGSAWPRRTARFGWRSPTSCATSSAAPSTRSTTTGKRAWRASSVTSTRRASGRCSTSMRGVGCGSPRQSAARLLHGAQLLLRLRQTDAAPSLSCRAAVRVHATLSHEAALAARSLRSLRSLRPPSEPRPASGQVLFDQLPVLKDTQRAVDEIMLGAAPSAGDIKQGRLILEQACCPNPAGPGRLFRTPLHFPRA